MAHDYSPPISSDSTPSVCAETVGRLLATVTQIADMRLDLSDSRAEILTVLLDLIDATAGVWTWGVSDPEATEIAVVAQVEIRFTAFEKTAVLQMGLDPTMHEEFRIPIMRQMAGRLQCTTLRTDLYERREWKTTQMYANLAIAEFDEWMNCVRYSQSETWASLFILRRADCPPFQLPDQQLIDLAMGSISWLSATTDPSLPTEACVALTSRQRMVLMMQLDGLSRKQIASRLQITTDTVGDHIKRIHEQFNVNSTGELAAIFLRNR